MSTTGNRILARVPFVDGWSVATLCWSLAFGIACRTWRVADAVWGSARLDDLWWAPRSYGVDAMFAIILWLGVGVMLTLARSGAAKTAARATSGVALLAVLALGAGNTLSFHVSGSALTLQRLRGADGATLRDMSLIAWSDVWPVALLAVFALAALVATLWAARHIDRWPRERRASLVVTIVCLGVAAHAQYVLSWSKQDHGYGRHPVVVLLESVRDVVAPAHAFSEFKPPPPTPEGWTALFTPDGAAESSSVGAPRAAAPSTKNVIVFFSEGVPLEHTSLNPDPHAPDTTPRIRARAETSGLVFTRFYSPYHRSIHALYSLLCGELPSPYPRGITLENPRIACDEFSTVFAHHGVKPALFHGGYFSFYDKMRFLGDRDYVALEDAATLADAERFPKDVWGVDDRAMVERALAFIDTLDPDDRFALVLVPIGAHYPYTVPGDVEAPFGASRKIDRFRNAVYFLDLVFDELMVGLEQRGLLDDTLVLFTADHGESPHEPPRVTNVDRAAYEYNVHVPAVMFSSSMFPVPQTTDRLTSIADILPTMLDAAGLEDVRDRQGRSALAEDWAERRVFLGAARSNVHQLGFLDGRRKFLVNMSSGRTELYDLTSDPDELDDLSGRTPPATIKRYTEITLTYAAWQSARVREWPFLEDSIDVHDLLARDLQVAIVDANGARTPPCARVDGDPLRMRCAGLEDGAVLAGITPVVFGGGEQRCFKVQAPKGVRIELSTAEREYFRFVSMLQVTSPSGKHLKKEISARLAIDIDGERVEPTPHGIYWRTPLPAPKRSMVLSLAGGRPLCLFFSTRAGSAGSLALGATAPDAPDP